MKRLVLLSLIALICTGLSAQETFFPTKVGTVLKYQTTDKKGKVSGSYKYTIKDVTVNGQDLTLPILLKPTGTRMS